jgi:hypothetical protein
MHGSGASETADLSPPVRSRTGRLSPLVPSGSAAVPPRPVQNTRPWRPGSRRQWPFKGCGGSSPLPRWRRCRWIVPRRCGKPLHAPRAAKRPTVQGFGTRCGLRLGRSRSRSPTPGLGPFRTRLCRGESDLLLTYMIPAKGGDSSDGLTLAIGVAAVGIAIFSAVARSHGAPILKENIFES